MWFVYSGYLLVRHLDPAGGKIKTAAAVLGIVAFLDVPLVFFSARLWRSVHPSVVASREGGLPESMAITLLLSLLAWGALCGLLLWLRSGQLELKHRLAALLWAE
jgi:heme exporter protein C